MQGTDTFSLLLGHSLCLQEKQVQGSEFSVDHSLASIL